MIMKYPFEFQEMLITSKVLDVLGFSEYWSGSSEFGTRSFGEKISEHQYKTMYQLVEEDEMDDPCSGYCPPPIWYSPCHYHSNFDSKTHINIYFLHDLYEDILENCPEVLEFFLEKTKEVNMYPYMESYLKYKNERFREEN